MKIQIKYQNHKESDKNEIMTRIVVYSIAQRRIDNKVNPKLSIKKGLTSQNNLRYQRCLILHVCHQTI